MARGGIPPEAFGVHTPRVPIGPRVLPGDMDDADHEDEEPYYWEAGGDDTVSTSTALAHNLHFWGTLALAGVDSFGSVLASTLGLTQSRYQFEIDYAEGQRENIRRQIIARRQRELLQREEARREVEERAGMPASGVSAARAASDAYAREVAERAAAGLPEVDEPETALAGAAAAGGKSGRARPRVGAGRPASKAPEDETV